MENSSIVKASRAGFSPSSKGYFCVYAFKILMFYLYMLLSRTEMFLPQLKNLVFIILLLLGDMFFFFPFWAFFLIGELRRVIHVICIVYRATRFRFGGNKRRTAWI